LGDDLRLRPDVVRFGARLGSASDEDDTERTLALYAPPDEQAVAGLEDVEWHQRAGKEHRPKRKERQQFAHGSTVLWRSVTAG
jgi:hypothetical protein